MDRSNRPINLGWIGTGVMGASMCGHLLANDYKIHLFTRTKAKAQELIERGACWADSPRAVAEQSEVLFTMVGFPQDVRAVYFGEDGILAGTRAGMVLVDMTTTEPHLSEEIAAAAQASGGTALDAPVSGGDVGARQATLSIMVGGDQTAVDRLMPLFMLMGNRVRHQGGPGAGQHTKLCNQIVIASSMIGVCESLLYGYKAGLDLPRMLESISGGAAACWTLDHLAPRMLARNFDPGFFVEHFVKDLGIALEESRRMGLDLPGLALAHRLYRSLEAQGHGRCGTQALLLALEELSDTTLRVPPH
ncbi:MAG: NAD(P)-dependent oxidoreductase [Nitrospiraceae bacterium]